MESAGRAAADPAIENQLHLVGSSDIQVLANDFLEEDPAGDRTIQDLGQRELGLQHRDLIPVTGLPVFPRKWMRQLAEPFPQQAIDLLPRQAVAERLNSFGIVARQDAVIQRLITDASLVSCCFTYS